MDVLLVKLVKETAEMPEAKNVMNLVDSLVNAEAQEQLVVPILKVLMMLLSFFSVVNKELLKILKLMNVILMLSGWNTVVLPKSENVMNSVVSFPLKMVKMVAEDVALTQGGGQMPGQLQAVHPVVVHLVAVHLVAAHLVAVQPVQRLAADHLAQRLAVHLVQVAHDLVHLVLNPADLATLDLVPLVAALTLDLVHDPVVQAEALTPDLVHDLAHDLVAPGVKLAID
ncbi:hypothetical protein [Niemeyer virus]|nr:hypothetical protein [Niemeyer virus]